MHSTQDVQSDLDCNTILHKWKCWSILQCLNHFLCLLLCMNFPLLFWYTVGNNWRNLTSIQYAFKVAFCRLSFFITVNSLASGWFWRFSQKNSSFRLPYQCPSSSADCARELFNGSNGSASLVDCTRKKFFACGVRVFCEWRHKWSSFRVILVMLPGLGPNHLAEVFRWSFHWKLDSSPSLLSFWSTF